MSLFQRYIRLSRSDDSSLDFSKIFNRKGISLQFHRLLFPRKSKRHWPASKGDKGLTQIRPVFAAKRTQNNPLCNPALGVRARIKEGAGSRTLNKQAARLSVEFLRQFPKKVQVEGELCLSCEQIGNNPRWWRVHSNSDATSAAPVTSWRHVKKMRATSPGLSSY